MFYILSTFLLAAPLAAASVPQTQPAQKSQHAEIDTKELKSWYDQNKVMTVIDARSAKYFNGTVLPNAIWLTSESTEKEILAKLPSKDHLIVVYCWGTKCPASGWLFDKLISLGYTNVHEYHKGLQDWMSKGYPTQNFKK